MKLECKDPSHKEPSKYRKGFSCVKGQCEGTDDFKQGSHIM